VPRVHEVLGFEAWMANASVEGDTSKVVLSLAHDAQPAREHRPAATQWLALSGPEGGLEEREEQVALERGFVPVTLGPRVLRAETAPIALLSLLTLS